MVLIVHFSNWMNTLMLLELYVKSLKLKEGRNRGFGSLYEETLYLELVSLSCIGAYFEN